jgi:hypothetical protein
MRIPLALAIFVARSNGEAVSMEKFSDSFVGPLLGRVIGACECSSLLGTLDRDELGDSDGVALGENAPGWRLKLGVLLGVLMEIVEGGDVVVGPPTAGMLSLGESMGNGVGIWVGWVVGRREG